MFHGAHEWIFEWLQLLWTVLGKSLKKFNKLLFYIHFLAMEQVTVDQVVEETPFGKESSGKSNSVTR